jgi:hypothetical protein
LRLCHKSYCPFRRVMNSVIFFLQKTKIHQSNCNNQVYPAFTCIYRTDSWFLRQRICLNTLLEFDVHVAVHRVKFLIIRPTRCTNFSNLFLEWNSTCFIQFLCPSSRVCSFYCTHSNRTICHTVCWQLASRIRMEHSFPARKLSENLYDIYHCCVYSKKTNSWWWTEELHETCRVSFQE